MSTSTHGAEVRILADDLTGALDAAAPFAAAGERMPVHWPPARPSGPAALDSETRHGGDIRPHLEWLAGAGTAFKKIDSLLRGTTLAEIRACIASGRFGSVVIAPAFPAQQRITRGGRQHWRTGPADPWQPLDADLQTVVPPAAHHVPAGAPVSGGGVFVCDAETADDLRAIAEAAHGFAPPTLWIGTAGLAYALAGTGRAPRSPAGPLLIVVGSHRPVTLAQVDALARQQPTRIVRLEPGAIVTPAIEATEDLLEKHAFAAFVFAFPEGTGADVAGPVFDAAFDLLQQRLAPPRTLLVTGGSTLFRLVRRLGAEALEVEGEWRPGIPISTLTGSSWHGTRVVSKSGGFGGPDTLLDLTRHIEESRP